MNATSQDLPLYSKKDQDREHTIDGSSSGLQPEEYRSSFRRDYARLIHSACFRRLSGKTQLFPNGESDFFRTRLTHSLEVAQVAKSIAIRLNSKDPHFAAENKKIKPEITEVAALAHDIGHPPFGHNGELALDEEMRDYGGFEGNAQTLRLLARVEKKNDPGLDVEAKLSTDDRIGLNLTYRTLAAVLKYDDEIPRRKDDRTRPGRIQKGYYRSEAELVKRIKNAVLPAGIKPRRFKTIECSIMDIADDIAYSTYDIEDSFKAGFTTPLSIIASDPELLDTIAQKVSEKIAETYPEADNKFAARDVSAILVEIFGGILRLGDDETASLSKKDVPDLYQHAIIAAKAFKWSKRISENGYYRNEVTSRLVGSFIRGVEVVEHDEYPYVPQLLNARLTLETFKKVEVLKTLAYENLIKSSRLKVAEFRGQEIVRDIFNALSQKGGLLLLPDDYRELHERFSLSEDKQRVICDFIAGMTDRYALDFYGRLRSSDAASIFQPL